MNNSCKIKQSSYPDTDSVASAPKQGDPKNNCSPKNASAMFYQPTVGRYRYFSKFENF